MNKSELISAVSEKSGLKKVETDKAISALVEVLTDAMKAGDKVQLVGFGTFESSERPERTGRNPHDGSTIVVPAAKVAKFKPGKALKDALNA